MLVCHQGILNGEGLNKFLHFRNIDFTIDFKLWQIVAKCFLIA